MSIRAEPPSATFMRQPNTFIVGAPKSGTTALVHYLGRHPNAFFCKLKEPGFWATDFPWLTKRNALPSVEHYLDLFRNAQQNHQIIGEASTMYLSSTQAAANIVNFNPQARFIVILRNPIEVAQAYHMQKLLVFQEDEPDFEAAWRLQPLRRQGLRVPANCPSPHMLQYGVIPQFGGQVRRLLECVPRDSIHFIRFEDFRSDPAGVYCNTLRFLNLDDDGRREFPVVAPSRAHRFSLIARLFHSPPSFIRGPVVQMQRHLIRKRYPVIEKLKRSMYRPQQRQLLSPQLRGEMIEHFMPEMRELEHLLGWDLRSWREPASSISH
jgi:hypothetical protein